ncbi:hypothetical protein HYPSUDRAFT_70576 [Hypholoma sublateritium FD-334 SS-4]|uniref:F-box domain-containing protein n=1 Tax=Hypholoma sublateritium (strain FD-334 SS-4) TaxID=945553 RepID=A0A0D2NLM7_HYPSF|nr:hypothetical protein HYPSUDRAFT_70576 [Hypholoma sublateritium FD-334 SS-4]
MVRTIQLPQEIYELFVDALYDGTDMTNNKETHLALRQCSRVSRVFWLRARRHFFAHTKICGKRGNSSVTPAEMLNRFMEIATKTAPNVPPVIKLVRSCSIQNYPVYPGLWEHPAFIKLLKLLINSEPLESLSLLDVNGSWPELDTETRDLLCAMFQTTHLKSLELRGFTNIPSKILDGCAMQHLTLYCLPGLSISTEPLSALVSPPPLLSIETNNEVPVLSTPLKAGYVPFPHLNQVASTISQQSHLSIACNLARGASQSLHTLDLSFLYCVYLPLSVSPFDLGQLPNLRHLRLGFSTDPGVVIGGTEYLKSLCHFISRPLGLEDALPLETIEFLITLPHEVYKSAPSFNKDHWRALDRAITRPHLAHVREVHLRLHFLIVGMLFGTGFTESAFVKETTDLAKPLFSRVDNSKSIDFTIDVSTEFVGRGFLPDF